LFIVGLSLVIASAVCVQVSLQQIQLRLCSKCLPLALAHAQSLVKVIQWLHFAGEVDIFDVTFLLDSVHQKLLKLVHFLLSLFIKIKLSSFFLNVM